MAASTLLEERKDSKRACPACGKKKLLTNDNEKFDDDMHHLCLNCGHEFSDNEQLRKYRDGEKKDEKLPWSEGSTVLAAMLAVIFMIMLSQQSDVPDPVAPQGQVNYQVIN